MRTANPALNTTTFTRVAGMAQASNAMTVQGTATKALFLLLLLMGSASWVWHKFFMAGAQATIPYIVGGVIGGLIIALITVFAKKASPILAPIYALLEGLALGGISAFAESRYPGVVMQAVGLTFGTLFCMLVAYKSRLIKVTQKFRMGVAAATGGIFLLYLATFVLGFFGVTVPYIHSSEPMAISIGISVFIVIIAALNLVLDFDFIETGAQQGAPKYMEWYAAFGLMVTLVWLYIEILRLLTKLRRR